MTSLLTEPHISLKEIDGVVLATFSVYDVSDSPTGMTFIDTGANPRYVNGGVAVVDSISEGRGLSKHCIGRYVRVMSPTKGEAHIELDATTNHTIALIMFTDGHLDLRLSG